jgi:hypothetical protein
LTQRTLAGVCVYTILWVRCPSNLASNIANRRLSLSGTFFVLLYYLPIYFQAIHGVSAEESGIQNLPMIVAVCESIFQSGTWYLDRIADFPSTLNCHFGWPHIDLRPLRTHPGYRERYGHGWHWLALHASDRFTLFSVDRLPSLSRVRNGTDFPNSDNSCSVYLRDQWGLSCHGHHPL